MIDINFAHKAAVTNSQSLVQTLLKNKLGIGVSTLVFLVITTFIWQINVRQKQSQTFTKKVELTPAIIHSANAQNANSLVQSSQEQSAQPFPVIASKESEDDCDLNMKLKGIILQATAVKSDHKLPQSFVAVLEHKQKVIYLSENSTSIKNEDSGFKIMDVMGIGVNHLELRYGECETSFRLNG